MLTSCEHKITATLIITTKRSNQLPKNNIKCPQNNQGLPNPQFLRSCNNSDTKLSAIKSFLTDIKLKYHQ